MEPYFLAWEKQREQLQTLFRNRTAGAEAEMLEAIQLYEALLLHCEAFDLSPINGEERLAFIKSNVRSFAAFRQLDELFTELKKGIARRRAQLHNE